MTEQARETPEPLTPEEAIDALLALLPGTLGHDRAILAAAENIATVALRAATPDPAEPGLREAAQAVLDELDIIRRQPDDQRAYGLRVHPLTHDALRAALAENQPLTPEEWADVVDVYIVRRIRAALSDTTERQS
jgi:hypothetical protein